MKRQIKNKELQDVLAGAGHLATYAMPGELTLAVVSTHKALKAACENYNEACKQIGESRCERHADGSPVTEHQKDAQGKELVSQPKKLRFRDAATEAAALQELKKLGEQEIEFEVKEFDHAVLEGLKNITPIQMEAIANLVGIKDKKRN